MVQQQYLESLAGLLANHLDTLARVSIILVLTAIALRLTQRLIPKVRDYIAAQKSSLEESRRVLTLSRVLRYCVNVVIVVIGTLLILAEFGISVAPILGAAGVIGIAIGFGAQSLVKDYFTGFFLLLENQVRHGDVVEAGGKSGLVEELTLRYLRLRDYDGNVHFIPNGSITSVTNMSFGFAYAVMNIGVAYREDVDAVMRVMSRVGAALMEETNFKGKILDKLDIAGVDEWADSSIVIRCRFRVVPLEQWNVRREYLRKLKQAFDMEGIEIPFPHMTLVRASKAA